MDGENTLASNAFKRLKDNKGEELELLEETVTRIRNTDLFETMQKHMAELYWYAGVAKSAQEKPFWMTDNRATILAFAYHAIRPLDRKLAGEAASRWFLV